MSKLMTAHDGSLITDVKISVSKRCHHIDWYSFAGMRNFFLFGDVRGADAEGCCNIREKICMTELHPCCDLLDREENIVCASCSILM